MVACSVREDMSHPPASQAARWLQGQGNGVVAEKKARPAERWPCFKLMERHLRGLDLPACILTRIEFSGKRATRHKARLISIESREEKKKRRRAMGESAAGDKGPWGVAGGPC